MVRTPCFELGGEGSIPSAGVFFTTYYGEMARVVYGSCLENSRVSTGSVGSNPTLSFSYPRSSVELELLPSKQRCVGSNPTEGAGP